MRRTRKEEADRRKTIADRRRHDHPGFGPDDLLWVGVNGELDFDAFDRQRRAHAALDRIVSAIIAANGEGDTERRRQTAMHALLGTRPPVGAPTSKEDDVVLLTLGRAVFLQEMGYADVSVPMTQLVRKALEAAGQPHASADRIRSLRERFDQNRDQYLYRASNGPNETDLRRDEIVGKLVEDAIGAIQDIGIQVVR